MQKTLLLTLTSFSTFIYADTLFEEEVADKFDDDFYSLFNESAPQSKKSANTPAPQAPRSQPSQTVAQTQPKPAPKKNAQSMNHFMVYGDFLYWQPFVTDATWTGNTIESNGDIAQDPNNVVKDYGFSFSWDYGFRAGLCFKTTWENLKFDAVWTRFHTQSKNSHQDSSLQTSTDSALGFSMYNSIYANSLNNNSVLSNGANWKANASYKIRYDQFDLMAQKIIMETKMFDLMPVLGVRGLVMNHTFKRKMINAYYGSSPATSTDYDFISSRKKNNSYAVGLVAGLNNRLKFGKGFGMSFLGDLFIGYGKSNAITDDYYSAEAPSVPSMLGAEISSPYTEISQNGSGAKFMTDVMVNLDWMKSFGNNSLDLLLSVGYEFHYIFGSPFFINTNAWYLGDSSLSQNMGFQGLTVRAGLGF